MPTCMLLQSLCSVIHFLGVQEHYKKLSYGSHTIVGNLIIIVVSSTIAIKSNALYV